MVHLYYILPYREILVLLSNNLLEDKVDKDFESESYVRQTIKNLLKQVDMLRTRNTSRLQESFDSKKITNCTLITDERIGANIIAFELTFDEEVRKESGADNPEPLSGCYSAANCLRSSSIFLL